MPGGDKTGPMGQGPMTGRALGYCGTDQSPGRPNAGGGLRWPGGGFGRGNRGCRAIAWRNGWGRGFGPIWRAPYPWTGPAGQGIALTRQNELAMLRQQACEMEAALQEIKNRMDHLQQEQDRKE